MTNNQLTPTHQILCIGAGYVGGSTMAVIADKCPEYRVTVVDINKEKIEAWNSDHLPLYEPGLEEVIRRTRGRNLFFATDIAAGIKSCDIIFVSVNTPTKTFGEGAGMAADLQYWEKTARQILEYAQSDKIVVEKCTLPVRSAEAMERIFRSQHSDYHFEVISNPEFLAEGTAIRDLEWPDRVLIGSRDTERGRWARDTIMEIYAHWVPREKIITMGIWSSELAKLAANAFLAQRISSINAISALCEKTGADITEVAAAIGMDTRIGSKFLNASIGFGGSCFKKDLLNLVYLCQSQGLDSCADYWEAVVNMNEYQKHRFLVQMLQTMFNTLAGKRICLFGFAFKAHTSDTRESPAITIARGLLAEQAHVVITDPQALPSARLEFANEIDEGRLSLVEDPYEAVSCCDAIALMTEWPLYRELDYERIYEAMKKPAFIFDGRNLLDHRGLREQGFIVHAIGKPFSLTTGD